MALFLKISRDTVDDVVGLGGVDDDGGWIELSLLVWILILPRRIMTP